MDIASRLAELRKQRGLSQMSLSERSGVSQSFISALEKGEKVPTIETLKKLCQGMDITLSQFFAGESETIPDHLYSLIKHADHLTPYQARKLAEFLESIRP